VLVSSAGHLQCPFCSGYDVDRLYLATLDVDSCVCAGCGARWDEKHETGDFVGRGVKASILTRRSP
jgi:hypothetical protein